MKPWHNGHYGHFVNIDHYGLINYGPEYCRYWCLCEEQEKCRSPVKAEWKKMQRLKSYGQNKIKSEIMAISFVFWARKWPPYRKHFPWVPRAHLYVFGISGARGMGKHTELIQNQTFYFFAPPNEYVFAYHPTTTWHSNSMSAIAHVLVNWF